MCNQIVENKFCRHFNRLPPRKIHQRGSLCETQPPLEANVDKNHPWKLRVSIYGPVDASRQWDLTVSEALKALGM